MFRILKKTFFALMWLKYNQEKTSPQNYTLHYYHSQGFPYNKMAVGITAAGPHFKLEDADQYVPNSKVAKPFAEKGDLFELSARIVYTEVTINILYFIQGVLYTICIRVIMFYWLVWIKTM